MIIDNTAMDMHVVSNNYPDYRLLLDNKIFYKRHDKKKFLDNALNDTSMSDNIYMSDIIYINKMQLSKIWFSTGRMPFADDDKPILPYHILLPFHKIRNITKKKPCVVLDNKNQIMSIFAVGGALLRSRRVDIEDALDGLEFSDYGLLRLDELFFPYIYDPYQEYDLFEKIDKSAFFIKWWIYALIIATFYFLGSSVYYKTNAAMIETQTKKMNISLSALKEKMNSTQKAIGNISFVDALYTDKKMLTILKQIPELCPVLSQQGKEIEIPYDCKDLLNKQMKDASYIKIVSGKPKLFLHFE